MTPRLALLILSLLGNLAAAACLWLRTSPSPTDLPPTMAPAPADIDPATAADAGSSSAPTALWNRFNQTDLPSLIHSLREAGFPPSVIRAIAQTRADADLLALKQRIGHPPETEVYWLKPEKPTKDQADAVARHKTATARQIDDLLRDLEADLPAQHDALVRKHGPFSAEKLAALERIERDYEDIRTKAMGDLRPGPATPEIQAAFQLLEQEHMADIAAALGPDDYLDYRLRRSRLASTLRVGLAPLNVNESEFRTIFLAAEASLPNTRPNDAAFFGLMAIDKPEFAAPRAALLQQLSATLPPDRFADLQQMFNPATYRERLLVTRLNLPLSTAQQVHELRTGLEAIVATDRASLESKQQSELAARETALRNQLQTLLGPEGYAGYNAAFPPRPPAAGATPRP